MISRYDKNEAKESGMDPISCIWDRLQTDRALDHVWAALEEREEINKWAIDDLPLHVNDEFRCEENRHHYLDRLANMK